MRFSYEGRPFTFFGGASNGDIVATFVAQDYEGPDYRGTIVVDVGANIGDSAAYFALRGARQVIAVEPHPDTFSLLLKNLEANGLQDVVTPLNVVVGESTGTMTVQFASRGDVSTRATPSDSGVSLPVVTLTDLLSRFHLRDPILKMDCEGCEYQSLLPLTTEVLRNFKHIVLEYHNGPGPLVQKLQNAGFSVRVQNSDRTGCPLVKPKSNRLGLISAIRQGPRVEPGEAPRQHV